MTKCKCSKDVWDEYRFHQCTRPATVEHDGKWWCWQHDPERVKAEAIKRLAAWQAEQDRLGTVYARRARNARLGTLVTEELAALLEQMAAYAREAAHAARGCPDDVDAAYIAEETALALAARIREALEADK